MWSNDGKMANSDDTVMGDQDSLMYVGSKDKSVLSDPARQAIVAQIVK